MSVYLGSNRVGSNKLAMDGVYGRLVTLSSALSLTTMAQKVPLTDFSGYGCSKSSNGIKVDEAGVYAISGAAYFSTGFTSLDLVHVLIKVNADYDIAEGLTRISTQNYYVIVPTNTVIVSLNADDVVYLYVYNQAGARGTVETRTGCGLMLYKIA